jgi:hypothetical protein
VNGLYLVGGGGGWWWWWWKIPWYPLDRRVSGSQSLSGRGGEGKNSQPLPGFEPPIIQPVAQRYTTELSRGKGFFSSPPRPDRLWGPPSIICNANLGVPTPRGKRLGCEPDRSPPSTAEAKNVWSYISTPQHVFKAWCLVKHSDNFSFFPLP